MLNVSGTKPVPSRALVLSTRGAAGTPNRES